MEKKDKAPPVLPTVQQLEAELKREKYRGRYWKMLRGTVAVLVVVAATAVLISNLLLPILRIYGSSMTPTLVNGNIVAAVRNGTYQRGDIIAFYYNNKILVKRVIGMPGEWVDMDENGNVTIDGEPLEEPYLTEKALGECDIELPYPVLCDGGPPQRLQRFPQQPGGLRFGRADCGKAAVPPVALG